MTKDEIREWLNDWLADHLGISPEEVESDRTLASYGLEAEELETMRADLEDAIEEHVDGSGIRSRATVATLVQLIWQLLGNDDDDEFDSAPREMDMDEALRDIGMA